MKPHSNYSNYHKNSSILLQIILSEYFKIHSNLTSNKHFEKTIHTVSGSTLASMRIFSWTMDDSPIAKVKNYCALLHQDHNFPKKERDILKKQSFDLWELGLETLDLIQEKKSPKKLMNAMEESSNSLKDSLKHFLKHFLEDENILFFLLRHHREVDLIFGQGSTIKLTKKREEFIKERYRKRHFNNLLPTIEHLFTCINS